MPEVCCLGTKKDGVKICGLHDRPLVDKEEALALGLTLGFVGELFCPVTGSAISDAFGRADALHDEIAQG